MTSNKNILISKIYEIISNYLIISIGIGSFFSIIGLLFDRPNIYTYIDKCFVLGFVISFGALFCIVYGNYICYNTIFNKSNS